MEGKTRKNEPPTVRERERGRERLFTPFFRYRGNRFIRQK